MMNALSWDSAATLLLIPTALEAKKFATLGGVEEGLAVTALCGLGPIAAAARTMQLIAEHRPKQILLVGIAGTYDEARLPIGSAGCWERVAIDGVGAGRGPNFVTVGQMGFAHWPGDESGAEAIGDVVGLAVPDLTPSEELLVTVCAAAGSAEEAAERRARWARATAEEMEGFGVALAGRLAGVPVAVVRGISNVSGDRDPRSWQIDAALAAARTLALQILRDRAPWKTAP